MDGRAHIKVVSVLQDIMSPEGDMMFGSLAYDTRTSIPGRIEYFVVAWHRENSDTRRIDSSGGDCYMVVTFREVVQGMDVDGKPCPVLICDERKPYTPRFSKGM